MSKHLLRLILALGLVTSLFVGAIGTSSASDHDWGSNVVYFPWVPSGAMLDGTGPYYGTVTIQNLESEDVNITVAATDPAAGAAATGSIPAHGSLTLRADQLGINGDDLQGSGVVVVADGVIAGVQKQSAPVQPAANARTGWSHQTVAGYTGLTSGEISEHVVLPIVQTNNEWNTHIRVTNFGEAAGQATVTLHPAGAATASMSLTEFVAAGETVTIDLLAAGIPVEWVGSATITANQPVGAVAERVKDVTNMLIINQSKAADNGLEQYAPLVFEDWFAWNTGISIANLTNEENEVTITYYAMDGTEVEVDELTLPANGMDFVYRPGTLGGDDGFVGSAIIEATGAFHGSVDEVKYFGDEPDVGHAMSYLIEAEAAWVNQTLALPLAQKGNPATGLGDTTGIQLFNPTDGTAHVVVWFMNQLGTVVLEEVVSLEAQEGHTVYTMFYDELPAGFQGSALVRVFAGDGAVVAASNNVNYQVQYDGSAAFNLVRAGAFGPEPIPVLPVIPPFAFTVTPVEATNEVGETHELHVNVVDEDGNPVEDVGVTATIIAGPHDGTRLQETTDVDGDAVLSYVGTATGEDLIVVRVQGIADVQFASKTWVAPAQAIDLQPEEAFNNLYHWHPELVEAFQQWEVLAEDPDNGPLFEAALYFFGVADQDLEGDFVLASGFGIEALIYLLAIQEGYVEAVDSDDLTEAQQAIVDEFEAETGIDLMAIADDNDRSLAVTWLLVIQGHIDFDFDDFTAEDWAEIVELVEAWTGVDLNEVALANVNVHTVVATVTTHGELTAGVDVDFVITDEDGNVIVLSDPAVTTAADGTAVFVYGAPGEGVDTITATVAGTGIAAQATKTWTLVEHPEFDDNGPDSFGF